MRLLNWIGGAGLKTRLIGLVLAVLLPLTALQTWRILDTMAEAKDRAVQANRELAEAVRAAFLAYVKTLGERGESLGKAILDVAPLRGPDGIRLLLLSELVESPTIHHFSWVSPAGWVVSSTTPETEGMYLGDRAYLYRAYRDRVQSLSDLLPPDETGGCFCFALAQPVWEGDHLAGILLTYVDTERLPVVFNVDRKGSSRFGLIDRSGRILFRSGHLVESLPWERRQLPDDARYPARIALTGVAGTSEYFVAAADQTPRMGAAVPVPEFGWAVFATSQVHEVLAGVAERVRRDLSVLFLVALLASIAAWRIAVSITRPLDELQQAAGEIMWGNYDFRVQRTGYGEVAAALHAFNAMAAHLSLAREQVQDSAARMALMLESTTDAFFALDHLWRFTYVNRNAERLLQRDKEDLLGMAMWEAFPKTVGSTFESQYRKAVARGESVQFEAFSDQLQAWCEVHAHPYPNGLAVFFRDVTERRAAAIALAAESSARELERQHLRAVLEILPVGVIIADRTGALQEINPEGRRIWAHSPAFDNPFQHQEYHGWWCSSGERLEAEDWALYRALHKGETSLGEEVQIEAFNGERRTILNSAVPLRDETGEIIGGVAVNVDISRQKAMEAEIRRNAALIDRQRMVLQRVAEGAPLHDVLYQVLVDVGRAVEASYATAVLLQEDAFSWQISTRHADQPDEGDEAPEGTAWSVPLRLEGGRTVGGLTIYSPRRGVPTLEEMAIVEAGARLAAIAVERHQREAGRAQKLQNLIDNMSEGVVALDVEGIVTINQVALRLLGLSPDAGLAGQISDLPAGLWAILEQAAAAPRPHPHRAQLRIGEAEVAITVWSVYTAVSRYGTVAILRDITAQAQLRRLQQSFVANVSHELRGPLTSVSATLEAIADGVIPAEKRQHYLRSVLQEMARLRRLSYDVVDLTRLDAGLLEPKREVVYLQGLLQQVGDTYDQRVRDAAIRLVVEPSTDAVLADPDRVHQVIINLMDNAVRFTPAGGTIHLAARPEADQVRISVSDTGPGIAGEHLPLVWERFYKVDPARSFSPGGGTGLGLSIVRELVTRMGGEVAVQSQVGKGTVFSFTLPLAVFEAKKHA